VNNLNSQNPSDIPYTKWNVLFSFTNKNIYFILGSVILSFFDNLLKILITLSLGWYTSLLFQSQSSKLFLLKFIPLKIHSINEFNSIFIILVLAKVLTTFTQNYLVGLVGEKFSKFLRDKLFESQLNQSPKSFNQKVTGKYLMRYSGDLVAIQHFITKGVLIFTSDLVFMLLALAFMTSISLDLFCIFSSFSLITGVVVFFMSRIARTAIVNRRNYRSIMMGWVTSRLYHFTTIKSFNRERKEYNSFLQKSKNVYHLGLKVSINNALTKTLFQFYFYAVIFILFCYMNRGNAIYSIHNKAPFFSFLLLVLYAKSSLSRLSKVALIWQAGRTSFNKLLSIYNLPKEIKPLYFPKRKLTGQISLKSISYLNDHLQKSFISDIEIGANSITRIVSFEKKTIDALFNLIQKKTDIVEGNLYFDDLSIKDTSAFEIRKYTTIVSLDIPLLGSTVFKAVAYNQRIKNKEKLLNLLSELDIQFIEKNEQSLQFNIGDSGIKLSLQDRIMLQFIRAFMTNKKIMLIDDVLPLLENSQREAVIKKLNALSLNKTIIIHSNSKILNLNVSNTLSI